MSEGQPWLRAGRVPAAPPRGPGRSSARVLAARGSQPVMQGSGLELAWRIPRSLGLGGGDLGETCAALRVLGLRDGVGSAPSPDLSVGLGGIDLAGAPEQSQDSPLTRVLST